jgi:hypothetical protein
MSPRRAGAKDVSQHSFATQIQEFTPLEKPDFIDMVTTGFGPALNIQNAKRFGVDL